MQVHYSALGGEKQEDTTQFLMKTTTEEPEFLLTTKPLAIQDLDIPAGNANVEVRETLPISFNKYKIGGYFCSYASYWKGTSCNGKEQ